MDFAGFFKRWLIALVLVLVTYNPTAFNYLSWTFDELQVDLPYKLLVGLILVVGYVIFLRATFRSIGIFGIVLIAAIFGVIIWILVDQQMLDPTNRDALIWIILVVVATIMGVGVSWSHVRRRISGQADVDDVEE
ncbi:hypothetical protein CVT23_01865 [Minwuia thermotolerans]|uniref:Uncharacterized protein n=2 Tax=Minwuia thermotolerans TaxID=2056226 RepID=A0A2M9G6W1_9PROT|nr:hypothetical protein CVT23_01865 [Minwuia thermotolerans]